MLELRREKLPIGDSGGQLLVTYHAEPDSAGGRSLALLGSLAFTDEAAAQAGGCTRSAHQGARIVRSLVSGPRHDQFWRK
jgi:hypothetical protein